MTSAAVGTSQDGMPRAVGSTPRRTKPRTLSISLTAMGPDTRCCCDTNPQLQPSLATPPSDKHRRGNRGHGGNTLPAYSLLHITCNCDDTDIDTMYCTCCITAGNSPTSLSVTTLFDTGANPTSFVNRQVAAWIESQQSPQAQALSGAISSCLSRGH